MDKELKPCPFCGADVESGVHIDVVVSFDELEDDTHYGVICENCGAEIGTFRSPEEAVEAWNRNIKNGYWIKTHVIMRCSKCFALFKLRNAGERKWDYCPACGARMDKKE